MSNVELSNTLMPTSAEDIEILNARAHKLALTDLDDDVEQTVCCLKFKLNSDNIEYGISQSMIDEVIDADYISPLNWLPDFILGVINWRGKIITILDVNILCEATSLKNTETAEHKIVIIRYENKFVGLLVNEVINFFYYNVIDVRTSVYDTLIANPQYFLGLLDETLILLDVEKILSDELLEIK